MPHSSLHTLPRSGEENKAVQRLPLDRDASSSRCRDCARMVSKRFCPASSASWEIKRSHSCCSLAVNGPACANHQKELKAARRRYLSTQRQSTWYCCGVDTWQPCRISSSASCANMRYILRLG